MYQYRGYGLSMGTMVAGYKTGPQLYMVDNDANRLRAKKIGEGGDDNHTFGRVWKHVRMAFWILSTNGT